MTAPHRVTAPKVEYRRSGVLSTAYYGEVTRGADDLSNFNAGSNLGTGNGS